jgi:hypothetical protein
MEAVLCSGRGLTASSLLLLFFLRSLSDSSSSPLSTFPSFITVFSDLSLSSLSDYGKVKAYVTCENKPPGIIL